MRNITSVFFHHGIPMWFNITWAYWNALPSTKLTGNNFYVWVSISSPRLLHTGGPRGLLYCGIDRFLCVIAEKKRKSRVDAVFKAPGCARFYFIFFGISGFCWNNLAATRCFPSLRFAGVRKMSKWGFLNYNSVIHVKKSGNPLLISY